MKTLHASQAALYASPYISEVLLVRIVTYTDRTLETEQSTFYVSDNFRVFEWPGSGEDQQFEPWLVAVESERDVMNHVPSPDGSGLESTLRRTRRLHLRNHAPETPAAPWIYKTMRASNLEFSRVEIATLAIAGDASHTSLISYVGQQLITYRGRVSQVLEVSDAEFVIELESELPQLPWLYNDRGERVPIVYGSPKKVKGTPWARGSRIALDDAITNTATTIPLANTDGLASSGSGVIALEAITWTGKTDTTITGVTRGASGSTAVAHAAGDLLIETTTAAKWLLASHPLSSISNVYIRSPYTHALVRLSTSRYTALTSDGATIAGETVASVEISSTNMRTIMQALGAKTAGTDTLELYADVTREVTPASTPTVYAFDVGTGWSVNNGTQSSETVVKVEGTASQAFTRSELSWTTYEDFEALTGWSEVGLSTFALESTIKAEGSNSFRLEVTDPSASAYVQTTSPSSESWTSKAFRIRIYVDQRGSWSAGDGFRLRFIDGAGRFADYRFGTDDLPLDTWVTIQRRANLADIDVYQSGFQFSDIETIRLMFASGTGANIVFVDWFEWANDSLSGVEAMQKNDATGDLTSAGGQYRVAVRKDSAVLPGTRIKVYFSNTAGVGTTKPATYWWFDVDADALVVDTWTDVDATAVAFGAAVTPNAIQTIGVEYAASHGGGGKIYVDNLRSHVGSTGVASESMPDILEDLLGSDAIDATSFSAAATDLGTDKYALDVRNMGESNADVLARLAFEARANLVSDERASGTVYRLLCAKTDNTWPTAALTLSDYESIREDGRDGRTLFTRFRHLWGYDASRGFDEDAFSSVRATTISAAELLFGRRDAPVEALVAAADVGTVNDVADYYETERSRVASLYIVEGVPWTDALALERGDIVSLVVPWEASAKKVRLIETTRRADGLFDLRAVAVP